MMYDPFYDLDRDTPLRPAWRWRALAVLVVTLVAAMLPLAEDRAESSACTPAPDGGEPGGEFPPHELSPQESLARHDAVFYGEVAVPARPCSLGWCAGLRVVRALKGSPGRTVLLRIATPEIGGRARCAPSLFGAKGGRWLVFADSGTSRGGQTYLQADDEGPSFEAQALPDLARLERRYRLLRAELDTALERRLGTLR